MLTRGTNRLAFITPIRGFCKYMHAEFTYIAFGLSMQKNKNGHFTVGLRLSILTFPYLHWVAGTATVSELHASRSVLRS
jgi:hypothetical protein